MRQLRTLVIGVANRGNTWAEAVTAHARFDLRGIADIDPQVLAQRGAQYSIPDTRRHADYEQALRSRDYDLAVVAVPNHLHYPVAKAVLEAGVHCLLEKPFAETIVQAEELVNLADSAQCILQIVQNYRFKERWQFIADFIRAQRLGHIAGVEASFHRYRPPRFQHEVEMSYPMLFLQAIHHLDWLVSVLPAPIVAVLSRHRRVPWSEFRHPSICHLVLECADGVLVSYRGSYESRGQITPYDGLWRFEFEQGDLVVNEQQEIWQITEQGAKREQLCESAQADKGDAALLDTLYAAITQGTEPPTSGRRNLRTLRLLFDVIAAGGDGQGRQT